jgi:hypothetical protein
MYTGNIYIANVVRFSENARQGPKLFVYILQIYLPLLIMYMDGSGYNVECGKSVTGIMRNVDFLYWNYLFSISWFTRNPHEAKIYYLKQDYYGIAGILKLTLSYLVFC